MNATRTVPAKPWEKLSPEIAVMNDHSSPGCSDIRMNSRLDTATATAATASDQRRPIAGMATPPMNAPRMPIGMP